MPSPVYTLPRLLLQAFANLLGDLFVRGEAMRRALRIHAFAVDVHVKDPAGALFQIGGDPEFVFDCGLQTGGLREVVSLPAVRDLDRHYGGVSSPRNDSHPIIILSGPMAVNLPTTL